MVIAGNNCLYENYKFHEQDPHILMGPWTLFATSHKTD